MISWADNIFQGGVSTAGGSVTLGLIADIYEAETQQFPLAFIVLSSCIGTSIGGIIGGPIGRCKSLLPFGNIRRKGRVANPRV